jgi:hypothetical protein
MPKWKMRVFLQNIFFILILHLRYYHLDVHLIQDLLEVFVPPVVLAQVLMSAKMGNAGMIVFISIEY